MTTPESGNAQADPRQKRRVVVLLTVVTLLILAAVPLWGRKLAFFRVHEVQVRGARYVHPAEILAILKIDSTVSIWSSFDSLEARVARHPQVHEARLRRWLPSTIIVEITENLPVALIQSGSGLRPYDENGEALPLDPSVTPTDLPVLSGPDTAVLRFLADLRSARPALFDRISEVRLIGKDQLRIELSDVSVLTMRDVSADRFDELSSVQRDLARRRIIPVELDLRFKDQVIARVP